MIIVTLGQISKARPETTGDSKRALLQFSMGRKGHRPQQSVNAFLDQVGERSISPLSQFLQGCHLFFR